MPAPRIPPLGPSDAEVAARAAGAPDHVTVLNVNRVLLRHPVVARNFIRYFWDLVYEGVLDARLRELAVLRIAWLTGSVYEWTQHWHLASALGLPEDDLLAVRDWRASTRLSAADRAVLAAADDVVEQGAIGPGTWDALDAALPDDAARLEVVAAVTGWRMVASILQSLDVPLEDGLEPWPPDGRGPSGPAEGEIAPP